MRRSLRIFLATAELLMLGVLIVAPRCANYADVFGRGGIYFTDPDCYARMTRARICAEHPGTILRHHDFENFPTGTTPHTTAPFDYLIVALSLLLRPLTAQDLDLAGAIVSPLLALLGGSFLWWWGRRMNFRHRWPMLILYAISPILVHGTELGRPDHQSVLIVLVTVALCAEWSLKNAPDRDFPRTGKSAPGDLTGLTSQVWSIVSGAAWALALWVSFYEPLLLLLLVIIYGLTTNPKSVLAPDRRRGWFVFLAILTIALVIERRIPSLAIFDSGALFHNWSRTIGELARVSPIDRIWFVWSGYLIVIAPALIWIAIRNNRGAHAFISVLLVATFSLTIWQARWSYFFVLIFVISLPSLIETFQRHAFVWAAFAVSILPVLQYWDARLWPDEPEIARRMEARNESAQLRELANSIHSGQRAPFLAPWWLSPAITYWSGQPGIAGSSHESLPGIAESARFFLSEDLRAARELLLKHETSWIFAYDSDRVSQNSATLLGVAVPERPLARVLDRSPARAAAFLVLSGQNGAGKLFRFVDKL